jgi:hypothetical protein
MTELAEQRCDACTGDTPTLTPAVEGYSASADNNPRADNTSPAASST